MTETKPPAGLPPDFDERREAWHEAVAGVFARVQRRDLADVPRDVWRKLVVTTYDGIEIRPLYTRGDDLPEAPAPGAFPYTRAAVVRPAERAGWGVRESFGTGGAAPARVNSAILDALANGTTDLRLELRGDLGPGDIGAALAGVYPDLAAVALAAGDRVGEAARALHAFIDAADPADPEAVRVELGAAPLTAGYAGTREPDLAEAVALAQAAAERPGRERALLVDAVALSDLGASDAEEVGFALAAGVDYVRALTDAGMAPAAALAQISFRFAAGDDQFPTIAKFRAARTLWARVAEVLGAAEAGRAPMHAVTAPVMFTRRDPWVNMLRGTVAAFAAGVGGADTVEVLPFDHAIAGGQPGVTAGFAARIARNANLLLLEESHLGFVVDPAGGSYYVEELTESLAERAWAAFAEVEAAGGFAAAEELIRSRIDATHAARRADIAHRRFKITAINEFPNLAEAPLPPEARPAEAPIRRYAADFEALRDRSDDHLAATGRRPRITLLPLGPLAKHNARTGFATNLLAAGGIEAINPGQVTPGEPGFAEAAAAGPVVVLCGADAEYAEHGAAAVAAARAAGAAAVLVAGPPKPFEGAPPGGAPDGHLTLTIDAVAELTRLLDTLGA